MSIDTDLEGSPAQVHDVADWLEKLKKGLARAGDDVVAARRRCSSAWEGATADAYYDLATDLTRATDEIHDRAGDAAVITRAYAQQLRWRQEDMADHRDTARRGGLVVNGTVIEEPAPAAAVPALAAGATPDQVATWQRAMDEHDEAVRKIDVWNDVVEKVRGTFDQIDTWVRGNLLNAQQQALLPSLARGLLAAVKAPDTYLGIGENVFAGKATALKKKAGEAATALARKRSGNPAVRAGKADPTESGLRNASKPGTRAGNLHEEASGISRWGKLLKWGGPVIATGLGGYQISQGSSPSRVGLEVTASIAGGIAAGTAIAAGAVALGLTAPAWGTAALIGAGAAVVGAGIAWGVGKAYESWVPQDVREKIDEGIKDTWHAVADPVGDGVSGAWRSVFG
jgi:hypothetical protein